MAVIPTITAFFGTSGWTSLPEVERVNYRIGRDWIIDPFVPQSLTITVRDPSAWTTSPKQKDFIYIAMDGATMFTGLIVDVNIEYGLTTAEDRATIKAEGALTQVARRNLNAQAFTEGYTDAQFDTLMTALGITAYATDFSYSIASAQTYTGNAMDFLNTLVATEVGRVQDADWEIFFMPRNYTDGGATGIQFSDVPADWTTYMKYDSIRFRSSSENYFTRVRIAALGLATQTESSGSAPFYELSQDSYDYTVTQADSHARYILNQLGTKSEILLEIGFSYQMQQNSAMKTLCIAAAQDVTPIATEVVVKFRGSTYNAICEGAEVDITPEDMYVRYYLSPQDLNSYLKWGSGKFYNKWDTNKWGF